jgi:hypothetical protein
MVVQIKQLEGNGQSTSGGMDYNITPLLISRLYNHEVDEWMYGGLIDMDGHMGIDRRLKWQQGDTKLIKEN